MKIVSSRRVASKLDKSNMPWWDVKNSGIPLGVIGGNAAVNGLSIVEPRLLRFEGFITGKKTRRHKKMSLHCLRKAMGYRPRN